MVYLDNAATSYPKPVEVYNKIDDFLRRSCANPGRSSHDMARKSAAEVIKAREMVSQLFNIKNPLRVGFTANATHALNMAIFGVLKKGDHVITTALDHNSVLRPLFDLKKRGIISLTVITPKKNLDEIESDQISKAIRRNTKLIAITMSSNVTGRVLPYKEIGEIASTRGIYYLLDASQGAGVLPLNIETMKISLLAFPGHKSLMGPQGTGGLYVDEGINLRPIIHGGTGSRSFETVHPLFMPDILESGTLNTPGLAGLTEGVNFIIKTGTDIIYKRKERMLTTLYDELASHNKIQLFSTVETGQNSGIIAFVIDGMDSSEIANILDAKYHIAVRPGFHCAPLAHKALGTDKTGLVRLSPGYFTTDQEIQYAIDSIKEIADNA